VIGLPLRNGSLETNKFFKQRTAEKSGESDVKQSCLCFQGKLPEAIEDFRSHSKLSTSH